MDRKAVPVRFATKKTLVVFQTTEQMNRPTVGLGLRIGYTLSQTSQH